jgi:glutamate dehydrogenase
MLVLADNVSQARALTLDARRSAQRYDEFLFVFDHMLATGAADRRSGFPSREALIAAPGRQRGVPRPVLAVAMGLAKNWGFAELMKGTIDDAQAAPFVERYFPQAIRDRFGDRLNAHPLRREIAATAMINHVINQAGISFISRLMVASDRSVAEIVAAYLTAEAEAGAVAARQAALGGGHEIEQEIVSLLEIEQALEELTRRVLGARPDSPARERREKAEGAVETLR